MVETEFEKLMSHLAPVDLLALMAKPEVQKKPFKHRPYTKLKMSTARRRWWKRKKRAAIAGRQKVDITVRRRRRHDGLTDDQKILARALPGAWSTRQDLTAHMGKQAGGWARRDVAEMHDRGLFERVPDPDWAHPVPLYGGGKLTRGRSARRFLYRLTPTGEYARGLALLLL